MTGCELLVFLLAQNNVEISELRVAIDLMAGDIDNQKLVISPQNRAFSEYLFRILKQHEGIKAIRVDEGNIVVRRRYFYE